MKAIEAPKKIYIHADNDVMGVVLSQKAEGDVEYTRTDSFIDKACSWLENNLQGIVGGSIYIEDFRNYMEGE